MVGAATGIFFFAGTRRDDWARGHGAGAARGAVDAVEAGVAGWVGNASSEKSLMIPAWRRSCL